MKRLSFPHQQANGGAYRLNSPRCTKYTIYSSYFRQKKGNVFLCLFKCYSVTDEVGSVGKRKEMDQFNGMLRLNELA